MAYGNNAVLIIKLYTVNSWYLEDWYLKVSNNIKKYNLD